LIVTDVRVRKLLREGRMKAIVSVTLDDMFVIHDVKVVEGNRGFVCSNAQPENSRW